ncbi:hypothetical protein GCM10010470_42150 [Saccharopolyspora taberi]|uniref:Prepilin type IV endopeptidase peptidase domain-containing protein n=1 Tax=Saccharopolyspora taberi TaxID=60895 RepID=A0ABN3VGD4_9PSEU
MLLLSVRRGVPPPRWWCESAVALLWAVACGWAAAGGPPWWWLPMPLALGWLAVPLAVCDIRASRLPDALTLPAYPGAAALLGFAALFSSRDLLSGAVLGLVIFAGGYLGIRAVSPAALGPGDVKLAGSLGAVVGAVSVPAVPACMLAAAVVTLLLLRGRPGAAVAHGPAMLAPAWLATAFPELTDARVW